MRYREALFVLIVAVIVFAALTSSRDHSREIDCGPEGKPVLNGTACIDRNPYVSP